MATGITWPLQVENGGSTDDGRFTAGKAEDIKNAVNDHKTHIESLYGEIGASGAVWVLGSTQRRASVTDANGVLVEYVALDAATEAQVANIKPGTNSLVWMPANFRYQIIGDGFTTSFIFTHGFIDGHVNVQVRNNASGAVEFPHIHVNAGNVTVDFAIAPATNAYTIEVSR